MKSILYRLALVAAIVTSNVASAHHSYGMFNREKEQKLEGTVQEFQWTNPHSRVSVLAPDGNGVMATWDIEIGPPGQLIRTGWKHNTLKPGDKVELLIHPLKDGSPGGHLLMVTTASGQTLYDVIFKRPPGGEAAPLANAPSK